MVTSFDYNLYKVNISMVPRRYIDTGPPLGYLNNSKRTAANSRRVDTLCARCIRATGEVAKRRERRWFECSFRSCS